MRKYCGKVLDEQTATERILVLFDVVESWVNVYDKEPPLNIDVLAKDEDGFIHLTQWMPSSVIFACQGKKDSSFNWQWKNI
ncbi:MAG: hypothetical protein QMB45_05080 [Flavobacteriales bacterium]|jgi:hypothetical protein|tara:strand:+ start:2824 stop:3066 length:243 start_codon:yes stop_codon:yes gene_type:complete